MDDRQTFPYGGVYQVGSPYATCHCPYLATLSKIIAFTFHENDPKGNPSESEHTQDSSLISLYLHHLKPILDIKIPNLMQVADNEGLELYTKDTCKEFHSLLCKLLRKFSEVIEKLAHAQGKPNTQTAASASFKTKLANVLKWGYPLQHLVRGAVIGRHLQTIASALNKHHCMETKPHLGEVVDKYGELEDVDAEVMILAGPTKMTSILKTMLSLLRSMMRNYPKE